MKVTRYCEARLAATAPTAGQGKAPAWVARSNEHAQVLLAVMAKLSPEGAGQLGVEGGDDATHPGDPLAHLGGVPPQTVAHRVLLSAGVHDGTLLHDRPGGREVRPAAQRSACFATASASRRAAIPSVPSAWRSLPSLWWSSR